MTAAPRILALFGGGLLLGQERGNVEALAALQSQGCEVLCLVRDEAWWGDILALLDARGLPWVKVPYIVIRQPGYMRYFLFQNPITFMRANWRFLHIVRDFRPTQIYGFNPLYVFNFAIVLALDSTPMIYRAGDEPTVHNWAWRILWRFVVKRTQHFVANSKFVANALRDHGVAGNRISVIYNAPPQRSETGATSEELHDDIGPTRISYVGQISEHKGVHVLVDAFRTLAKEYPNVQLTIAGRISDWSGDAWARKLRELTLGDAVIGHRVFFIGEISDVPKLLIASSVHVAPSLFNDPSPNVVMEAKQAGCPSIVFPRGGMPELVENDVDGFVCSESTATALAKTLKLYLEDPDLATQHGTAALASLTRLGVPQFSDRWLAIFADYPPSNASVKRS